MTDFNNTEYIDRKELVGNINRLVKLTNKDEQEWVKDECIRQAYCLMKADVVPRSEVERLTKKLLDKDIEMENEVHRLEAYIEQIEKEAEDWESVAVNREARINKLQSILLQFTDIVHKWGAKHNFDTTEISLVPILEQEANSIIDQAKQEDAQRKLKEIEGK